MTHILKAWPEYFQPVARLEKTFELRRADRAFEVGDVLHLKEWCPDREEYTGESVRRRISYVMDANIGLQRGFCILGLVSDSTAVPLLCGEVLDLLSLTLPYVEEAEKDPAYKPGVVANLTRRIKAAIK